MVRGNKHIYWYIVLNYLTNIGKLGNVKNIGKLGNVKISENLVKETFMNREEILNAVQSEKQELGEYERTVARKAIMYGAACGVAICMVMMVVELFIFKKFDLGKPTILFAISGFAKLYEGIKNKIKKMIIGGTIELFIMVIGMLVYIGALFV